MDLSEDVKLRGLPWQLAQNVLDSVFAYLTVFGSVFLLFLDELGLPKAQMGLLLSLMPFCGVLALGFAPVATRLGRRRVFLACWAARKLVVAGLLLLPWVMGRFGHDAGVIYLIGIVGTFAVLRALAETAWYPWVQEAVPDRVRGRYGAVSTVLCTIATCVTLLVAGQVIQRGEGLERFRTLIAVGCVFGLAGVAAMIPVPGGRPRQGTGSQGTHLASMRSSLRDRNFIYYLMGLGSLSVGTLLYLSFLPLFLKEHLGLPAGTVVTLEIVVMIGGALASLLWGWAADRVGSRPVLIPALMLALILPLGWLLLPRQTPHPLTWCALLYFAQGVAASGTAIATGRLLMNSVVLPSESTAYMAIYYAWMGLVGGAAPLSAGALLQAYHPGERSFAWVTIDAHALLFTLAFLLIGVAWACYARVRPDGPYRTRDAVRAAMKRLRRRASW